MSMVTGVPPLKDPNLKGKATKSRVLKTVHKKQVLGPILNRFTVVWVQPNGVPFRTPGFFARVFVGNRLISTRSFDRFGVVRFNNIGTLTNVALTIRIFNSNGILFRTRRVPAGVEAFAVIG